VVSLPSSSQSIRIAVIGDVHNHWNLQDAKALQHLGVHLVLFVGDIGNENVSLVREIAALDLPKAVILGNHDAWYTMTQWGREKCPYDRSQEDWVQAQLDILGPVHVGYGKLDFPQFNLSVVGSRPFSWGGPKWRDKTFYQDRYGIRGFLESTDRMVAAAHRTPYSTILMIGHCGPTGLGDQPEDPCGKDWPPRGGDYGDPDFAAAITQIKKLGKTVPLVAFGHMHHNLRHTNDRLRCTLVTQDDGTVYLNAARTPRIQESEAGSHHYFSLVELKNDRVVATEEIWFKE
jgi:uncharacterized protein (TIGR04168 family)